MIKLLLIGGYGNVGRKIVSFLYPQQKYALTIAGRNLKRALGLAAEFNYDIQVARFDSNSFDQHSDIILQHDLIVSCIDFTTTQFASFVLQHGKVYIDITANDNYLQKIEGLNTNTISGLAILSVGLAPGLTNLMVKQLVQDKPQVDKAEIFIQLGLGEKNGKAAVQWLINHINDSYTVVYKNKSIVIKPFVNGKREKLNKKNILFYPFNFSDQHVVYRNLQISTMSYLGFDSNLTTYILSLCKRMGLFKLLKFPIINQFVLYLFTHIHFGSSTYRIKVKTTDANNKSHSLVILGNEEAMGTARVVNGIVDWVYHNFTQLPRGVRHIEEILSFSDLIDNLDSIVQEDKILSS